MVKYNTLLELAPSYGTDKHYGHDYFNLIYDKVLTPLKYDVKTFIEVGVFNGDSILLWRDFFENATIVGVDIDMIRSAGPLSTKDLSRIDLLEMDISKESNLESVCNKYPNVDIILDDASHTMFDQQNTLAKLFKILKPGGLFILEDLHTSLELIDPNRTEHQWGDPNKTNTLGMLQDFIKTGKIISDYMTEEEKLYLENQILSVEVHQSHPNWSITSIITKK